MCDLLWSDPDDRCGWGISPRGAGYTFGQDISEAFSQSPLTTMAFANKRRSQQRPHPRRPCPSARHGGLLVVSGTQRCNNLLSPKLLLPLWKPGCDPRGRRLAQVYLVRRPCRPIPRSNDPSLQFDPAPRAGEPLVSRRPPDYVSINSHTHADSTSSCKLLHLASLCSLVRLLPDRACQSVCASQSECKYETIHLCLVVIRRVGALPLGPIVPATLIVPHVDVAAFSCPLGRRRRAPA